MRKILKTLIILIVSLNLVSCFEIVQKIGGSGDNLELEFLIKIPKKLISYFIKDNNEIPSGEDLKKYYIENIEYSKNLSKLFSNENTYYSDKNDLYILNKNIKLNTKNLSKNNFKNEKENLFPNISTHYIIIPFFYPKKEFYKTKQKDIISKLFISKSKYTISIEEKRVKNIDKILFIGPTTTTPLTYKKKNNNFLIEVPIKMFLEEKSDYELIIQYN